MTTRLDVYLMFERLMLEADEREDSLTELIRDLMDPLWYELSDEEHALLDNRGAVSLATLHPVRLPGGTSIYVKTAGSPPTIGEEIEGKNIGRTLSGWKTAA